MTEKQYQTSIIIQIIFNILMIINMIWAWIYPVTNNIILAILLCGFIDLREEMRQQFYLMKKDNDIIKDLGNN